MNHLKTTDYSDSRNARVALSKDLICKEMEHGRKGMGGGPWEGLERGKGMRKVV